jgi:hypothetical protein
MFIRPESLVEGDLLACNGCGAVGASAFVKGWRSFPNNFASGHHCPPCGEYNDLVRAGLVYGVSPDTAVIYHPEIKEEGHGDRTPGRAAAGA